MQIIMTKRKSAVLSGSTLACLSSIPTINVTLGCAHDCVYCYGKTYKCYPGEGKLLVYSNLLEKARAELQRKHRRPPCVYFCPSCDPFQPLPGVLDVSYGLMEFFLGEGAGITFLTKARVPERFVRLFERHPGCVSGQVGLTALDEDLLRLTEPMAASPKERLAGMSELSGIGVPVAIRLDPIWPALTDTEACLDELLKAAKQNGAKAVAASYLFLRPKLKRPVFGALAKLGASGTAAKGILEKAEQLNIRAEGSSVLALPAEYRKAGYARVKACAERYGLPCRICGCKNCDLTAEMCGLGRQVAG